jgi:hypothetical protein
MRHERLSLVVVLSVLVGPARAAAATAPVGVLLGIESGGSYRTLWIVQDRTGARVVGAHGGLVVPRGRDFVVLDVASPRVHCGTSESSFGEHRRDVVLKRALAADDVLPEEVTAYDKKVCEEGAAPCEDRSEIALTFVTPELLGYAWSGYSDCGAHPDGSGAHGVVRLESIGSVFEPSGAASERSGRSVPVSFWTALGTHSRPTFEDDIRRAVKASEDTCCCFYAEEIDESSWHLFHGGGRWRAHVDLKAAAGQYCYGTGFEVEDLARAFVHESPAPLPTPVAAAAVSSTTSSVDAVCAPTGGFCVVLRDGRLFSGNVQGGALEQGAALRGSPADLGQPQVVLAEWALGRHVDRWTSALRFPGP